MKFKDISISVKLRIGFSILMLFIMLLGIVAYNQGQALWSQTYNLYEHPLKVRRALGSIKSDILIMHRNMKDLAMTDSEQEFKNLISQNKQTEARVYENIKVLYAQYLGPKADVDSLYQNFVNWGIIREETVRIMRTAGKEAGYLRTKSNAAGGMQIELILRNEEKISNFAIAKGDEFYHNAEKKKAELISAMFIILLSALGFSFLVSYYLTQIIQSPLKELVTVANQFKDGNYEARSTYLANNEIGLLANSYNNLASTLQSELSIYKKTASVSAIMLREEEIYPFCRRLLESLMTLTSSQAGAVFLLNAEKTQFEHFDSIGLKSEALKPFHVKTSEGEIGLLLATGEIQHIHAIPPDTMFNFVTVHGEMQPREIISIPIMRSKEIIAVISLSSIYEYEAESLRLIRDILPTMASRMMGVLFFDEVNKQAIRLEQQNAELEAQKNELAVQAAEVAEQNTELEMQKQELDEANRLKSVFLSNMSHELRTPLNSIIALSGVLSRRLLDTIPETEYSYLNVIGRNGYQLLSLINDILDISRIEAGKVELDLSGFHPHHLIDDLVKMIEPQANEKKIQLRYETENEIPMIYTDYTKCRHILQNLIGNAVKFTNEGEVLISVSLSPAADQIVIAVSDTGIGIAPEKLPHIFDEFRQADETTSRRYGGSGLGLAIAQKYALLLNGRIDVQSTPNKGSVFTLWLPLGDREGTVHPFHPINEHAFGYTPPDAETRAITCSEKTILVVEDSEPAIIQLEDILHMEGYNTLVARNGREALELIAVQIPDGIILDLMMPEVDGFEVLKQLRSISKTTEVPVLILTAKHVTKEEMSFLTGNHVYQLIQKGEINKTDLLNEINNMLSPQVSTVIPNQLKPRVNDLTPDQIPVVLVVEDNEDNLLTIRALLDDKYKIIEALDGRQGVDMAKQFTPDLILMDIALPILNGLQAFELIRNDKALCHIPIIAVTASVMKGNKEEILNYGFDDFIAKPINHIVFHEVIERILYGAK